MPMPRLRRLSPFVVLLVLACGGEGGDPAGPDIQEVSLQLVTSAPTPFQAASVVFPSRAGSAGAKLSGTLGAKPIQVVLADSVSGSFLVPDLAPGSHRLEVSLPGSVQGVANVQVAAAPVIANVKEATQDAVTLIEEQLAPLVTQIREGALSDVGLTEAHAAYADSKLAALRSSLAQASDAELRQVALFLEANPELLTEIAQTGPDAGGPLPAGPSAQGIDATYNAFVQRWTQNKVQLVGAVGACALATTAASFTGVGALVIGSLCSVVLITKLSTISGHLDDGLNQLVVVPFALTEESASLAPPTGEVASAAPSAGPTLDPNTPGIIRIKGGFRSLNGGDRGLAGAVFSIVDELGRAYGQLRSIIPDWVPIPAWTWPGSSTAQDYWTIPGSDLVVSAPGCSSVPVAEGVQLTCQNSGSSDITVPVSVSYRNGFGSVQGSTSLTVRRLFADVWVDAAYQNSISSSSGELACYRTTVLGLNGNSPVTFLSWSTVNSNGTVTVTDGASSSVNVDPRVYSGMYWHNQTKFWMGWGDGEPITSFTIHYTWQYRVDATGEVRTLSADWSCG